MNCNYKTETDWQRIFDNEQNIDGWEVYLSRTNVLFEISEGIGSRTIKFDEDFDNQNMTDCWIELDKVRL